jgi:predicted PhzF superfamily epimerase YddE/YHI9
MPIEYQVASFVGEGCLGNHHRVCVDPDFASPAEKNAWLDQERDIIAVLLFTENGGSPRVEFHQMGHSIRRCGSGTLAAAHVLVFELGHMQVDALVTDAGPVSLRREGDWLGYGARGLPLRPCENPALWQALTDQDLASCWSLGGEQDYCLLELPSESAVKQLIVDADTLSRSSDRALIATAIASTPGFDYVLRYFAPQRGKAEDPATGSANLQLASFWRSRLKKNQLKGRQLSKEGGEFALDITHDRVWVMGKTRSSR